MNAPHREFKDRMMGIVGTTFLSELFIMERPWTHNRHGIERRVTYIPFEECPFSQPMTKKDSRGRPMAKTRWIDYVFFVAAGDRAAYHGDCFTIGIEMKGSSRDLWRDKKIATYLRKTDYTLLGVPEPLLVEALRKAKGLPGVGVFSLDTGRIILRPRRQEIAGDVFRQMYFRALFSEKKRYSFLIEKHLADVPFISIPLVEDAPEGTSVINNVKPSNNHCFMNYVGTRTNETRFPRLEIKNGKLNMWQGSNQPAAEFDYAQGKLLSIDTRRRTTANGEMVYCDILLTFEGEKFYISTIASSCVTADLISRLANVKDPQNSILRIDVWKNNKYSNVVVKENGCPVPFRKLPRLQKIDRGFKVETDSSERDTEVMKLIDLINSRIKGKDE